MLPCEDYWPRPCGRPNCLGRRWICKCLLVGTSILDVGGVLREAAYIRRWWVITDRCNFRRGAPFDTYSFDIILLYSTPFEDSGEGSINERPEIVGGFDLDGGVLDPGRGEDLGIKLLADTKHSEGVAFGSYVVTVET